MGRPACASSSRRGAGTLLVRMTKPNSITSHDWHVQPICQRSLRVVRLSGALWIEVRTFIRLSSNLVRIAPFLGHKSRGGRFCANLLKLSKSRSQVKQRIRLNNREPLWITRSRCAKNQRATSKNRSSRFSDSREINSRVMQWLVLSRDSLQGFSCACLTRPYEPAFLASHFPLGAGHIGHREAPLLLSTFRVAQATRRCNSMAQHSMCTSLQLVDNINMLGRRQAPSPVETLRFLWETRCIALLNPPDPYRCFGTSPRSVSPFTKYCIASATSSKPMIRTRMRMPVSPSTPRTRAAAASTSKLTRHVKAIEPRMAAHLPCQKRRHLPHQHHHRRNRSRPRQHRNPQRHDARVFLCRGLFGVAVRFLRRRAPRFAACPGQSAAESARRQFQTPAA